MDAVPEEEAVLLGASERRRAGEAESRHVGLDARRGRIDQAEAARVCLDVRKKAECIERHDRDSRQRAKLLQDALEALVVACAKGCGARGNAWRHESVKALQRGSTADVGGRPDEKLPRSRVVQLLD